MKKLVRMITYICKTIDLLLTIGMHDSEVNTMVGGASFGIRYELQNQTGATL
jgi:hypothetical protein